jgi:GSCFA family
MNLTTSVKIPKSVFEINHNSKILTLGSCFADNMGVYLAENKFDVLANPFGNVYNVVSLLNIFESTLKLRKWNENDFVVHDELWFHYDFHTEIHAASKDELIAKIEAISEKMLDYLKAANVLILTLGTSWVYKRKTTGNIVANCHKQPASEFSKELLSTENQNFAFEKMHDLISSINPNLQIILTVSPVRHIKDGLPENSVSKALLRVLGNNVIEKHGNCHYFPSFEIMIDELRDYRFYGPDLIHPSETAIAYISKKFSEIYFSKKTQEICTEWTKINESLKHRPLNGKSQAHQLFLNKLYDKVKDFSVHFDVSFEQELIKKQIL